MTIKNEPKIKNPLIVAIREQLEHRALWMYLLVDEARKKGAKVVEFFGVSTKGINPESEVVQLLNLLAFKPNLKGYDYFTFILKACKADKNYHHRNLTTEIYPDCAKYFGATPSRVERAVRHSIGVSYNQAPHMYKQLFDLEEKPTNGELISKISKYLQYV